MGPQQSRRLKLYARIPGRMLDTKEGEKKKGFIANSSQKKEYKKTIKKRGKGSFSQAITQGDRKRTAP